MWLLTGRSTETETALRVIGCRRRRRRRFHCHCRRRRRGSRSSCARRHLHDHHHRHRRLLVTLTCSENDYGSEWKGIVAQSYLFLPKTGRAPPPCARAFGNDSLAVVLVSCALSRHHPHQPDRLCERNGTHVCNGIALVLLPRAFRQKDGAETRVCVNMQQLMYIFQYPVCLNSASFFVNARARTCECFLSLTGTTGIDRDGNLASFFENARACNANVYVSLP